MAHPDDPELACGGTIAQWTRKKDIVSYILVTSGDKGTWRKEQSPFQIASKREQEAKKAAQFLGVKTLYFLRYPDGSVYEQNNLSIELALLIRFIKPDTIVTHDPWRPQFHPDHRVTALAVIDAIMRARDWHFNPSLYYTGFKPHRPRELLLTPSASANYWIDITETYALKINAIKLHKSQLAHLRQWERHIYQRATKEGKKSGYQFAEAFYRMVL